MQTNQLISSLVFLAGVALLCAGIYTYFRRKAQLARSLRTQGVVIELLPLRQAGKYVVERTPSGMKIEPKSTYRAVVRFETDGGRKIKFKANLSTRSPDFKVGDRVNVVYDPGSPESARIDRPLYLWFEVGMLVFFGLFGIFMGLLGVWLQS